MKEQHQQQEKLQLNPSFSSQETSSNSRIHAGLDLAFTDESKRSLRNHISIILVVLALLVAFTVEWGSLLSKPSAGLIKQEGMHQKSFFARNAEYKDSFLRKAQFYSKQSNSITKYLSEELQNLLEDSKFYDIHSFIHDQNLKDFPFVLNQPTLTNLEANQLRKVMKINKSEKQLQNLVNQLMYPKDRPRSLGDSLERPLKKLDLGYFADQIRKHPNSRKHMQAQLYRYDKLYNVGHFEKQLPLCIIITGKNHPEGISRLYDSIARQNYTNYKIVHIDDHSKRQTVEKYAQYLSQHPELAKRLWLLFQRRQMNKLFNKYFGVKNYCKPGDVVLQIDADDYLVGRQVFQLVNTVYQLGNHFNGTREDIWAAYFNHISITPNTDPVESFFDQIPFHIIVNNKYRTFDKWRTTRLSTYLRDIFIKINASDMVDPNATKKGDYYVAADQKFVHYSLIEICGHKHLKFFDEYVYHYAKSDAIPFLEGQYSTLSAVSLTPYARLQSQEVCTTRLKGYKFQSQKNDPLKKHETLKKLREEVIQKRKKLKQKVEEMFSRDKKAYIENEKKAKENKNSALDEDI